MNYAPITTEQIKDNLWIARTILAEPLNCEVKLEAKTEVEVIRKLKLILEED